MRVASLLSGTSPSLAPFIPALLLGSILTLGCSSDPEPASTSAGTGGTGHSDAVSSGAGGSGGAGPEGLINGKVKRYDYAFDLTAAMARSTLSIDVSPPGGDCFAVNCGLGLVDAPEWNSAPAASTLLDLGVLTLCGEGVPGGAPLSLAAGGTIKQKTFISGLDIGFTRRKDKAGGQFSYLLSWVGGCDHFGPCDDDPAELAEFHFEVTHPSGSVVLCPGALTKGDTLTKCDVAGTLAPTYSAFAIASDPLWARSDFGSAAGVNLAFYEVPTGTIASSLDKPSVLEFMTWITDLLGPFPYGSELRVAGGPTAWLGFEHPANIILQEDLPDVSGAYADPTMHVLMHEIVHQWAGDRTTLAATADFVWKEATAEYLSYVFEDEKRPPGEAAATLAYWDSISAQSLHYPRPTDDPTPAVEAFYGDVYGPGPLILYVQLESMVGRAAVLAGVKAFLSSPGAKGVNELQAALSMASGKDLAPYFNAWVFGEGAPEWPSFSVELSQQAGEVTVTLTQQNASGSLYGCAVEVEVHGASTSARALVDFGVDPKSAKATATIPLAEPLVDYTLDPDHRLIDKDITVKPLAPAPKKHVWIF